MDAQSTSSDLSDHKSVKSKAMTIPEEASRVGSDSRASTSFEPSYQMEPTRKMRNSDVQKIAEIELENYLFDQRYEPIRCRELTREIAAAILTKIKSLGVPRYKYVVMVSLGGGRDKPGLQLGSRCLWNDNTDTVIKVNFQSPHLFAVAMVYGLYQE